MGRPRKKRKIFLKVKEVPEAINEIISYLSVEFSNNKLFERDDLLQDLYVEYMTDLQRHPEFSDREPGWWFIRLKWCLLTKWRRRVNQINREWDYKKSVVGDQDPSVSNYESTEDELRKDQTKYHF